MERHLAEACAFFRLKVFGEHCGQFLLGNVVVGGIYKWFEFSRYYGVLVKYTFIEFGECSDWHSYFGRCPLF